MQQEQQQQHQQQCQGIAPCVLLGSNITHHDEHQWPGYPFPIPQCLQLSAWGHNNLLAFVVPSTFDVWVVDGESLQVIQTLNGHNNPISCLLWVPTKDSQFQQNAVQLLVGDSGGHVTLWDVAEGAITKRIRLPHNHAVANLQLLSSGHLLMVVTGNSTSYVYDAQLNQSSPIAGMHIPSTRNTCPDDGALLVSVSRSPLAADGAFAMAWSDKIRILQRLETNTMSNGLSKGDVLSKDFGVPGDEPILDVCFSCSTQEILYVATPSRVVMYDWKLDMVLNDRFLVSGAAEFKYVFPSWQFDCPYDCDVDDYTSSSLLSPQEFPALYTITTDWKIAAWYSKGNVKYEAGLADGRAGFGSSKTCYSVNQHAANPMCFVVTFVDGSVSQWRFSPRQRRWACEGYLEGSIVRPVCICPLDDGIRVAVALQSGAIAIQNILYGVVERRCLVVKAASTQIRSMHTTTSPDEIAIVTERASGSDNALQVCLFNVNTFSVLQLIREGDDRSLGASPSSKLTSSHTDDSQTYLLLEFEFGAFEVWNLALRKLIHLSRGVGAGGFSRVFWGVATRNLAAVSTMYKSQTSLSKSPQQMVGVAHDTTLIYYVPLKDKLALIGEKFHMPWKAPHSNLPSSQVIMAGYGDKVLSIEGGKGAFVARGLASPKVAELASMPHQTQASQIVFCTVSDNQPEDGDLVAVVFQDGSFGVWNVHTRRQVGYSWSSELNIKAVHVRWLKGMRLLLMTDVGTMVVVTTECTAVNATLMDRRLQKPLQSSAFLLPTHSAHLKTHCEMNVIAALADTSPVAEDSSSDSSPPLNAVPQPASPSARSTGYTRNIALESSPFWTNCYGQRLSTPVTTLVDELQLHRANVLPQWLQDRMDSFAAICKRDGGNDDDDDGDSAALRSSMAARILQWVSWYFGHSTRASFWWAVHELVSKTEATPLPTSPNEDRPEDQIGQGTFPPTRLEYYLARFNLYQGIPYSYPSPISESRARSSDLKHNQARLVLLRLHALQLQQCLPVDDSRARLSVARDLLRLDELGKASEVLLESNFSSTNFAAHAQLALNIAAANDRKVAMFDSSIGSDGGGASSAFQLTSKRAAAMLLARGDVEGAVEMFVLIQEHYEACLTLQSCGRWVDAAVLAQLAPNVSEDRLQEILTRWARHCAQRGNIIPSVLLLLKVGALSVVASLLSDSSQYSDVAGVFILFLAAAGLLSTQDLSQTVSSPLKTDQIAKVKHHGPSFVQSDENDDVPSLRDVIKAIRGEYHELLESTMNIVHAPLVDSLLDPAV